MIEPIHIFLFFLGKGEQLHKVCFHFDLRLFKVETFTSFQYWKQLRLDLRKANFVDGRKCGIFDRSGGILVPLRWNQDCVYYISSYSSFSMITCGTYSCHSLINVSDSSLLVSHLTWFFPILRQVSIKSLEILARSFILSIR